jgi:site-specific recombinase XerD
VVIDQLFVKPSALARHRRTPCGAFLDGYLQRLKEEGFAGAVLRSRVCVITRFGEYLMSVGVGEMTAVNERTEAGFYALEERRNRGSVHCPDLVRKARMITREFLRHAGVGPRSECQEMAMVSAFCVWLLTDCGLQSRSVEAYASVVKQFLGHLGGDGSLASLQRVEIADVEAFLVARSHRLGRQAMALTCCAVRSLLRFAFLRGWVARDFSTLVITPRLYSLERLPCALDWDVVQRLVNDVDVATPVGLRDRAILLLLATYGVRAGEIVLLRLEDVDWRREAICFRRSKDGAPLRFPLTQPVGEAILGYLQGGRPKGPERALFLRSRAPFVALSRGSAVSWVVRKHLQLAGVDSKRQGAHVIRHSLAVHLLRCGHPLKTISDMLGHREPSVAFHYTKLDLDALRGVALSAEGVLP